MDAVAIARSRVAANGTAQVDLLEPTNDPRLNRLLLDTLKTWPFFPALEHGNPVESSIDIRVPITVR